MNFMEAIQSGLRNYTNFSGRAFRSEFWYWVLFTALGGIVTTLLDMAMFADNDWSPLNSIFSLLTILPSLAVGARRLHDIGRTGWWQLLLLTLIGVFVLIYWWVQPGEPSTNQHGPNPLGGDLQPVIRP